MRKILEKSIKIFTAVAMIVVAVTTGVVKAAEEKSIKQPFSSGVQGSKYFRIPAMVTLNDGTIVTAVDARWDTILDGGGLDTLVAYSNDHGQSWNYNMANHLEDNGNKANPASTAFLDPALATDGETVYMIVDLFPAGYALNGANHQPIAGETGFNKDGYLRLSNDNRNSYNYYLKDGKIYKEGESKALNNLSVDAKFNVTGYYNKKEVKTNLFFADSPFEVYPTNYLYLSTSNDAGKTWSNPTLINAKKNSEQTYLIGPGNGVVTSTGRIIFTCYEYTNGDKFSSIIYSDDQGKTWKRSANMTSQSTEATIVEADGRLYMFTRYNGYYVSENNGSTWSDRKETSGKAMDIYYRCQRSAITYSEKIDGKTAILLSCPSGSARSNGKIYVGLVNEDGSLDFKYQYKVTNGEFSYSCLTELKDGTVSLLYENANGSILYENYPIETIANGAKIGIEPSFVTVSGSALEEILFNEGDDAKTVKFYGLKENEMLTVSSRNEDVATVKYDSLSGNITVTPIGAGETTIVAAVSDGARTTTTYELKVSVKAADEPKVVDITIPVGFEKKLVINSGNMTQKPNEAIATAIIETVNAGYKKVDKIEPGKQYLLINDWSGKAVLTQIAGSNVTDGKKAVGFELRKTNSGDIITGDEYINYLWTLEESSDGKYAFKAKNGQYLFIDGDWSKQDVHLQNEAFYATLTDVGEGKYRISNGNACLENQASANNLATAYYDFSNTEGNQVWHFYEYDPGYHLTIKGISPGKTTMFIGEVKYNITVREQTPEDILGSGLVAKKGQGTNKVINKLTTNVGMTFDTDLKDKLLEGQTVEWVSDDPNVASIDQNGTITGITVGNTIVKAVVKDSTGKVVAENPIDVTVLAGNGSDGTRTDKDNNKLDKIFDFYIAEIEDTKVYYNLNCATTENDMIEIEENEVIYLSFNANSNVAMNFFGDPDEGYALTYMNAPGSAGEYESLDTKDNPELTDFYINGAAKNQIPNDVFGKTKVKQMIQLAMNIGCDGAQGFTRAYNDPKDCNFVLSFRSEKLPEITKEVVALRSENGEEAWKYEPGMSALVGQEVFFKITVHKEAYITDGYKQDAIDANKLIEYTNMKFTDTQLPNLTFYDENGKIIADNNGVIELPGEAFKGFEEVTKTYYVGYRIKKSDLDSSIYNKVDLDYNYSCYFSKGQFGGTADDDAQITASNFKPENVIIDYGSPLTINYENQLNKNNKELVSGKANYGNVSVNGNSVTYVPSTVLLKEDVVTLKLRNTQSGKTFEVSFKVYPATSVYYEENFASFAEGWSYNENNLLNQTTSFEGSNDLYGYDSSYVNNKANSNNTLAISSSKNKYAEFTFNGDGVDIYSKTNTLQGNMVVYIYKNDTLSAVKVINMKNTFGQAGENDTVNDRFNTPVLSFKGDFAKYTLKITAAANDEANPVNIDGFRVYNTLGKTIESVYAKDKEDSAKSFEFRDIAIAKAEINLDEIQNEWHKFGGKLITDVYDATNNGNGAVIFNKGSNYTVDSNLIDAGPKNEIYLQPGQSIAMSINANQDSRIAIGMRSLYGETVNYAINNSASKDLSSSMDMYYEVTNDVKQNGNNLVITNNSKDQVLALTKIRITKLAENLEQSVITSNADTMEYALKCIAGYVESPLEKAMNDAAKLNEQDYTKKSWKTLEKALEKAEKLLAKGDKANEKQIEKAVKDINDAINELVKA